MSPAEAVAIEVTHFRQILLVPFALEARAGTRGAARSGGRLVREFERHLAPLWHRPPPWERAEKRWLHLAEDDRKTGADLRFAYAEFVYFEPYVQRFLFGGPAEPEEEAPIRLWRRRDVTALDVEVRNDVLDRNERLRLRVDRVNLYLFDTGNALLVVELRHDPDLAAHFPAANLVARMTLDTAQAVVERARRVFPPYFLAHGKGKEAPLSTPLFPRSLRWVTGDPKTVEPRFAAEPPLAGRGPDWLAAHRCPPLHEEWRRLLRGLPVEGYAAACERVVLSQLGDDRAFSLLVLGVDDVRRIGKPDWVRLAMADTPEPGWPYAPAFLDDFFARHAYDRFFAPSRSSKLTSRYLFSAYAFAQVGTCARPGRWDFFREILVDHGRRHYFQLVLISYFQKTALLTLSERLAAAMAEAGNSTPRFRELTHAIQRDVLRFTHRYWFENISAQIQGQEIFELLRRHLRTRELYEQVSGEVREADQFLAAEEQGHIARAAARLNRVAFVGLLLTTIFGFLGMNVFDKDDFAHGWLTMKIAAPIAVFILLFAALYYLPWRGRSK